MATLKGFNVMGLVCVMLVVVKQSSARQFSVGGSSGWSVPSDTSVNSYNQWAERNRFQIGDSLLFVYNANQDSVLQVSKDDYTNCNTTSPIAKYTDGHTVFTFNQSGSHYFVSGNKDNCLKNEKLVVVVLADRSKGKTTTTSPPPPPESTPSAPSPTPSAAQSPPPTVESNPSPTPAATNQPKNAASSMLLGSTTLLFASSLAFVL